jgi:site-specific DNA-methyltransferase (adenine-specific)
LSVRSEEIADGVTVYLGDCREIMPTLSPLDAIITDLPYGTTDCAWDARLGMDWLWAEYRRLLPKNGAAILNASQPFTSLLVASNLDWFKVEWIWEKNAGSNFGTVKWQPMKEHESVLVFSPGSPLYNPVMEARAPSGLSRVQTVVNYNTKAEVYQNGALDKSVSSKRPDQRYPRSIQKFNRERGLHPTQKPLGLLRYFVETYTNPDQVVLDHCMGSGTTGVACAELGRRFIGIEIEPKHFDTACRRLAQATAPKERDGQPEFLFA